eukprot:SAG22_NODE_3100_length_1940_cov_3.538294_2_plen_161_part_00
MGALSGAATVGAGAVGTHALPAKLRSAGKTEAEVAQFTKVFETGAKYHLVHSAVLLCAPACRYPSIAGGLVGGGTLLFCGSLYAVAAAGSREGLQAKVAPVGGGMLILGWLVFFLWNVALPIFYPLFIGAFFETTLSQCWCIMSTVLAAPFSRIIARSAL